MAGGTINLAVKTTNDGSGLKAASNDMDAFGGKLTAFSAIATGGLLALGAGAIKMSADYQQAMSQVAAVSGATGAELTQLKALGKDIGADTAFSARDAAGAMQELAAGGRSVAQIMGGEARAAVDLAAAGNYGLADSGRTIATVMDVWKNSQIDTNDVVNRLAGAANASRFGVEDMSAAVAQAGGVAASMGVEFEDFTAAIAATASSFASGSDAGTSYKTFLLGLDGSTDKAKAAIAELGLEFRDSTGHIKSTADIAQELADKVGILGEAEQVAALKTIFGNDAYRTAVGLMNQTAEGVNKVNDVLGNTNAADIAATRMDNAMGSFEAFKGSAETLAISLGDKALPAMTQMADAGVVLLNGFGGLPESTQQLGLGMVALATAAPAAAAGVKKVADMVSTMKTSGPGAGVAMSGIALGIGAAAIAVDLLVNKLSGHSLMEWIVGDPGAADAAAGFVKDIQDVSTAAAAVGKPIDGATAAVRAWKVEMKDAWSGGFGFEAGTKGWEENKAKVKELADAMVSGGATAAQYKEIHDSLTFNGEITALGALFDAHVNYQGILNSQMKAVQDSAAADLEQIDSLKSLAREYGSVADAAPVATTALDDFRAGLEADAKWADELGARLDTLAGRFGSLDPQMAINNINLAILKEELADVTRAGGDFSDKLGMTVGQMEAQIAALDGSNAALGENEDAYRTLMGEMEKLAGPAGTVSGAVLNIDAAIRATNLSAEDQIEVAGQVGQAMTALATGNIPAVVSALLTIGETSPLAMKAFVDGIKDPAQKEAIIAHVETIAPAVAAVLRPAMQTAGEESGAALGEGAVTGIGGWGDAVFTAGENLGTSAGDGMAAGIRGKVATVAAEAWAMVRAAMGSAADAQASKSPSKEYEKLGKSAGEGYALGLKASEPMVAKAAAAMVGAGVDGAQSAIGPNGYPMEWVNGQWVEVNRTGTLSGSDEVFDVDPRYNPPGTVFGGTGARPQSSGNATAAGGIIATGKAPATPSGKLPLVPVGQDVFWDPNTGTFVNGTTNMPGTDATWNPATGELGTDAVQANGGLTVYQGSDGKWRRVVTDELATNPDGTWKTERDRLDAIAYQSRAQAGNPALHTGGEHGIADGIAGSTMGVTGAYASGYLGYMMADAIKYRMRPNELGHGALSDRFYNYGQDMSGSGYGKSMYGPEARTAPAIDPWHPNALGGGMTRYWETDDSSAGGSWKTAGRRQVADTPRIVNVNVSAMDSQSFLRAAPQIREALRLDDKSGGF